MLACIGLVVGFRSSTGLAAAYGVAVTMTMVITTLLFYVALRERFSWGLPAAVALSGGFLAIDVAFFGANIFKIPAGGWFPLVVGAAVFTGLTTWRTGRRILGERIRAGEVPLRVFVDGVMTGREGPPQRTKGTAVFLFSIPGAAPPALIANYRHNNVLHDRVIVLSVVTDDAPRVLRARRSEVADLGHGFFQVVLHYGFMEEPDIPTGLTEGPARRIGIDVGRTTYFLGAESLVVTGRPGMARWRERLFALFSRNATTAADYFGLPSERTMTVGMRVEL